MSDALISIRPVHVDNILRGTKKVEIRRKRLRIAPGTRLWIYSTLPSGKVEGVATVSATESGEPGELWNKISDVSGTTYDRFLSYSNGCSDVFILWLTHVQKLADAPSLNDIRTELPGFMPPQSFMWLSQDTPLLRILESRLLPSDNGARGGR